MRKILALIEKSHDSKNFIHYALSLASDLETNLDLLYAVEPESQAVGTSGMAGAAAANIQSNLQFRAEEGLNELEKHAELIRKEKQFDIQVNCFSEVGIPVDIVERYMNDGSRGIVLIESGRNQNFWFQERTNFNIISNINYPIWVVPYDAKYVPIKKILYASDLNHEDMDTMRKLILHFFKNHPEITALHISDSSDFEMHVKTKGFKEMLHEVLNYDKVDFMIHKESKNDHVETLINKYSDEINADLITVLKQNRGFLERIFRGSTTRKIVNNSKVPVLVYHEGE